MIISESLLMFCICASSESLTFDIAAYFCQWTEVRSENLGQTSILTQFKHCSAYRLQNLTDITTCFFIVRLWRSFLQAMTQFTSLSL